MTTRSKAKVGLRNVCLTFLLLFGGCWTATLTYEICTGIEEYQEQQLRIGMTKEEVVRVLGKPHGGETMDKDFWIYWTFPRHIDPLKLGFDQDGRLCAVSF